VWDQRNIRGPDAAAREWRRTVALLGATALGFCFLTGYLPALRDVRMLAGAEGELNDEIRELRQVNDRLRREIRAAQDDPLYAEALQRSRAGGRLPDEPVEPEGWRVPAVDGMR